MNQIDPSWQPSCSLELIELRAKLLHDIRCFFYAENVLEVETPSLCQAIGTDPYIDFFSISQLAETLYLQTSPEFAMKRLLAAHSGSIYQISKAFRRGESSHLHNPEFTLLEWYRVDYNLAQLMDDVERLLRQLLCKEQFPEKTVRVKYADIFKQYTGLNALFFDLTEYHHAAVRLGLPEAKNLCANDHGTWLNLLFSHFVQQHLGVAGLCMVYDYPACLPSLARLQIDNPQVVERVEIFIQGIELGNGYFELADMQQQQDRFEREILLRKQLKAEAVGLDQRFLSALKNGLPDCSGIAIGLDRLLMVLSQKNDITEVLAFPVKIA